MWVFAFRLIEWIFYNINSEDTGDEVKAVFLKGLYELLSSEGGKSPHAPMLPVSTQFPIFGQSKLELFLSPLHDSRKVVRVSGDLVEVSISHLH